MNASKLKRPLWLGFAAGISAMAFTLWVIVSVRAVGGGWATRINCFFETASGPYGWLDGWTQAALALVSMTVTFAALVPAVLGLLLSPALDADSNPNRDSVVRTNIARTTWLLEIAAWMFVGVTWAFVVCSVDGYGAAIVCLIVMLVVSAFQADMDLLPSLSFLAKRQIEAREVDLKKAQEALARLRKDGLRLGLEPGELPSRSPDKCSPYLRQAKRARRSHIAWSFGLGIGVVFLWAILGATQSSADPEAWSALSFGSLCIALASSLFGVAARSSEYPRWFHLRFVRVLTVGGMSLLLFLLGVGSVVATAQGAPDLITPLCLLTVLEVFLVLFTCLHSRRAYIRVRYLDVVALCERLDKEIEELRTVGSANVGRTGRGKRKFGSQGQTRVAVAAHFRNQSRRK